MALSTQGALFIGAFEGFEAHAYNDAAKPPNATIGYGHVLHPGAVTAADRKLEWTRAKALAQLQADAATASAAVVRAVRVPLTVAQRDALISFAFNCGGIALTGAVGAAVNSRPAIPGFGRRARWKQRVQDALCLYDHAGTPAVLPGLWRRRMAESRLFAAGLYTRAAGNPYANA